MFNTPGTFAKAYSEYQDLTDFHTICTFDLYQNDKKLASLSADATNTVKNFRNFVENEISQFFPQFDLLPAKSNYKMGDDHLENVYFDCLSFLYTVKDQIVSITFRRVELHPKEPDDSDKNLKIEFEEIKCGICDKDHVRRFLSNMLYQGNVCQFCFDFFIQAKWS
ncbi:hypothetical protein M153_14010002752 [Pseudoloma neurophilia]|uniref:Uncharacterized protein n=1 Tax=Pseudoloma neurophilia TaxID=146866 RepID=A0A0R0LUT3_9MICR|nr:hypothetical protein M153_14010002752 [Pseudoloma neurophilia]